MKLDDIQIEQDLYLYIGYKFENFKILISKLCNTENLQFYRTQYDLGLYGTEHGHQRQYGGGRVDMMFGNSEMLVPIELKYNGNANGYCQLKKYVDLTKKRKNKYDKKVKGILFCYNTTKELKDFKNDKDKDVIIIDLSLGEAW